MFLRRHIMSLLLTAAVLFAGLIGVTHVHSHRADSGPVHGESDRGHVHGEELGLSCCPPTTKDCCDPGHDDSTPCDRQHDDDCQLCSLIASFVTTLTSSTSLVFDSSVSCVRAESPHWIAIETPFRVRGRAPPIG